MPYLHTSASAQTKSIVVSAKIVFREVAEYAPVICFRRRNLGGGATAALLLRAMPLCDISQEILKQPFNVEPQNFSNPLFFCTMPWAGEKKRMHHAQTRA